ncbi:acyltransferase family protein [Bifidobacterium reuteri]|nr:acyltransferase [Bifidobacterium reuteri]
MPSASTAGQQSAVGKIKRRPRLFYLDFIRALAAVLIVITHFNNPFMLPRPIFMYEPFGIYVGGLGVSLFLIISGAALMYNHGEAEKLDLKSFYWKRFKTLYPMFWIAFIVANAFLFLRSHGNPYPSVPIRNIVFSILGVDGMVANTSIPTFYTLGEWFLGFIVIFYMVFPLLRWGVRNHPVLSLVVILVLYVATLLINFSLDGLPKAMLLTTRLPELAFGMYFTQYIKKVPWSAALVSLVFLVVQEIHPLLVNDLGTTFVGIAAFILLVYISRFVDYQPIRVPVKSISRYSYPIFLVHHVVIIHVFNLINPTALSTGAAYLLFFADFAVIMVFSVILYRVNRATLAYVRSMFVPAEQ